MYLQDENFDINCCLITYNPAVTLSDPFVHTSHRTCIAAFIAELAMLFTEQLLIIFLCGFSLQLPTIIADNAGYDSADLVAKLRAAHTEGKKTYGLGKHFVTQNLSNREQCGFFNRNELARFLTTTKTSCSKEP